MRLLECTEAEAEDIIETDKLIDNGKRSPYDMDKKAEREAIKIANVKRMPKKQDNPKEKVKNSAKSAIIDGIVKFLNENVAISAKNVKIAKDERQVVFQIGEDSFELNLVQKRRQKPKADE